MIRAAHIKTNILIVRCISHYADAHWIGECMRDRKVIRKTASIQLLADETRMKMIYLLRAKEMTVSQVAGELGLTPQTIYHHIKKLREADMVEVSREERMDHLTESYYRATAGMFYFTDGCRTEEPGTVENVESALEGLKTLGFRIIPDAKQTAQLAKLLGDLRRQRKESDIVDRIYQMDDLDSSAQDDLILFAAFMSMDDDEFERHLEIQRSLRQTLLTRKRGKG